MHESFVVAGKEFRDGLRNRWVLAITLVFALLAIALAWFGAAISGEVGFTRVATTIASLASLAVFLIPLIALMLAYDSIVGEDENGTLLLLMTYPLSRTGLLAGKFLEPCGHPGTLHPARLRGCRPGHCRFRFGSDPAPLPGPLACSSAAPYCWAGVFWQSPT